MSHLNAAKLHRLKPTSLLKSQHAFARILVTLLVGALMVPPLSALPGFEAAGETDAAMPLLTKDGGSEDGGSEDGSAENLASDDMPKATRYLIDTGPLRIRDQFPLSIGYLGLDPVSAVVLDRGKWQVDAILTVTNTWAQSDVVEEFLLERTSRQPFGRTDLDALDAADPGPGIYLLDAEMIRTAIAVRRGIGRGVQLELLVPLINFSGGFLDSTVEGFHDTFSFSQAGRQGVARDGFLAGVQGTGGSLFIDEDPGTQIGDIVLGAKFQLREPNGKRRYHLALETVAELPTGEEDGLTSNGSLDLGAQFLYTRYYTNACLHLSAGLIYLGEWEELGIESQILPSFMVGWEQGLSKRSAAVFQATVTQTPFDDLGLDELSATSIQMTIGYKRVVLEDKVLFLGVTENLQNFDNTADVGLHLGLTWIF